MDIIIISDFMGSFCGTDNSRFLYLANLLKEKGHKVEIITSNFNHSTKTRFQNVIYNYNGIAITMLEEYSYSKNICLKRFLSHYVWGKRVGKYLKKRKKPDAIFCAIPTLKASSEAGKYCKKNNIKFIIDIQDLWPEAYKMVFSVPILSSILFLPFKLLANSAYKKADEIVAVSQTYADRALKVNKKVKKAHPVYLGTDLDEFDTNVKNGDKIDKKNDEFWIGYCGTLGSSYDLRVVFDALKILNKNNVKFVVMGNGPKMQLFKDYSKDLNVAFTGNLSYKNMCAVLSECDIVVNPIMHNAAQSIINKHADYAAAGKAVLSTQENKEYYNLINEFHMGFNVSNGNPTQLAEKVRLLMDNKDEMLQMGVNSRKCAEQFFDRKKTYLEIVSVLTQ